MVPLICVFVGELLDGHFMGENHNIVCSNDEFRLTLTFLWKDLILSVMLIYG